jgi:anti-sigma B factor antagonist
LLHWQEGDVMFSVDLDVREYDDYVIVELCGELDLADAAEVAAALTAAAAGGRKTIVDLAGLAFIDCSGATALARAQRWVRQVGGTMLLVAPRPRVQRVFELSRLIDGVSIRASVEQATGFAEVSGLATASRPGALSLLVAQGSSEPSMARTWRRRGTGCACSVMVRGPMRSRRRACSPAMSSGGAPTSRPRSCGMPAGSTTWS